MDRKTQLVSVAGVMLVVANIIAAKIITVPVPFIGEVAASAGVFPIAITFLCTDILTEEYGKAVAREAVWSIVGVLVLGWGLIQLAVVAPHAGGVPQEMFAATLQASTPLVIASITSALVVQLFDVTFFSYLRTVTNNRHRWVRNIVSTTVSQLFDTTLFTVLAFSLVPMLIGGTVLPWGVIGSIIVVEYILKCCIAVLDTPIFYALTTPNNVTQSPLKHD
jgi:uncharacterized integral membrane protein (TIGR00697 family)